MGIAAGTLLVLLGALVLWFSAPYSPLRTEFERDVTELTDREPSRGGEVYAPDDFAGLPDAMRRHLELCGYVGAPRSGILMMEYRDVDFRQSTGGPSLVIDYTQYNFAGAAARLAFIDSGILGVPFQGYDYYRDGRGGMRGIVGKAVEIFDQTVPGMDQAALVTFLAESPFLPEALLREDIELEQIDDRHVRVTARIGGQEATGMFEFGEDGLMASFTTESRGMARQDGTIEAHPWTARCGGYERGADGILRPTSLTATWHLPDGDFTYFDGEIANAVLLE